MNRFSTDLAGLEVSQHKGNIGRRDPANATRLAQAEWPDPSEDQTVIQAIDEDEEADSDEEQEDDRQEADSSATNVR